jgi:hypothetical protein
LNLPGKEKVYRRNLQITKILTFPISAIDKYIPKNTNQIYFFTKKWSKSAKPSPPIFFTTQAALMRYYKANKNTIGKTGVDCFMGHAMCVLPGS